MGIVRKQDGAGRKVTSGGNSHEMRNTPHEMRQAVRPNRWPAARGESPWTKTVATQKFQSLDFKETARSGKLRAVAPQHA